MAKSRRKFKSEKLPSENPDLWIYKTKDLFFCYASHLIYVQRAFWMQLVETAGSGVRRRARAGALAYFAAAEMFNLVPNDPGYEVAKC